MIHRREFLSTAGAAFAGVALAPSLVAECRATSAASKGPYWRADAPFTSDLRIAGGEAVTVYGVVRSARTCRPVAGALLDVWQADHHGRYDLDYRNDATFGRARVRADAKGAFSFVTVRPAPYGNRPAHIHFVLSAEGHRPLVTQLYFEGDPHLSSDPLNDVHADLVRPLRKGRVEFDLFLA
jgi:protocatechuate 3,4-dioxygenase beta subunit